MRRILGEPLLHFLLLGAGLFIAWHLLSAPRGSGEGGNIVVTRGRIEHLATGFAKTWQRPPTDQELKGLVDDWVREEIATREALALGLDKGDTVIRRRLRQKLEFVSDDAAAQVEPSDADLEAYLRAHADAFRVEPRITFSQVYLDPARHGDHLARDAVQALARLNAAGDRGDSLAVGDPLLLDRTFKDVPAREIARQFGDGFAAKVAGLPAGPWQGPVESGFGVHLVRVTGRAEGRLPQLAEVRDAVRREWENARRVQGSARFYEDLLKRYTVTIEGQEAAPGQAKLAEAH